MSGLRSYARLRSTGSLTKALTAARYSSQTPPRAANVLPNDPSSEFEERASKFREELSKAHDISNQIRQRYEDANVKLVKQDRELNALREDFRNAQWERDDAQQRLQELVASDNDAGTGQEHTAEGAQVTKYKERLQEMSKRSNQYRQQHGSAALKLAKRERELSRALKGLKAAGKALDEAQGKMGELEKLRSAAQDTLSQDFSDESHLRSNVEAIRDSLEDPQGRLAILETSHRQNQTVEVLEKPHIWELQDIAHAHFNPETSQDKHSNDTRKEDGPLFNTKSLKQERDAHRQELHLMRTEIKAAQKECEKARNQLKGYKPLVISNQRLRFEREEGHRKLKEAHTQINEIKSSQEEQHLPLARNAELEGVLASNTLLQQERDAARERVAELETVPSADRTRQQEYDDAVQKAAEVGDLYRRIDAMQEQRDDARDKVAELQETQKGTEATLDERDQAISQTQALQEWVDKSKADLDAELEKAHADLATISKQLEAAQKEASSLHEERDKALQEMEDLTKTLDPLRAELKKQTAKASEDVRERAEELELVRKNLSAVQSQRDKVQAQVKSLEEQLENSGTEMQRELDRARTDTRDATAKISALRRQVETLNEERDKARRNVEKAEKLREQHTTSLKNQLNRERSESEREGQRTREQIQDLGHTIAKVENEISKKKSEKKAFQELCINQDLNVIKRMLPSMPEPEFTETLPVAPDPAVRLANWLDLLDGGHREGSSRARSMLGHNSIVADEDIMCIYTDGAMYPSPRNKVGSAAVIPSLGYARLQQTAVEEGETATSSMSELDGLMLALETAADLADRGQRIVIFTDYKSFVTDDIAHVWIREANRDATLQRGVKALHRLEKAQNKVRLSWLTRNAVVGARLAHQAAQHAAGLKNANSEPLILSDDKWYQGIMLRAVDEARDLTYLSDVG